MTDRRGYGEGSLRERFKGVWQLRVSHDGRTVTRTFRGTERAARGELARLRGEAPKLAARPKEQRTVRDLSVEWWSQYAAHSKKKARRTLESHALQLRLWILPHLGHIRLDRLRARDIDLMYRAMSAARLTSGSIKRCHAVLSLMLKQALKWDWLDANPLAKADTPEHKRREIHPPATAAVDAIVRTAKGQWKVMFRLAAASGMRRGELCGLRWEDITWATGVIHVRRSIAATRTAGPEVKATKTNKSRRVEMDVETMAWIGTLAGERQEQVGAAVGYVFSPDGGASPFSPDSATQQFGRVRKLAGACTVRLHDLRHWHASYLLTSGQPIPRVQQRLGHDHASTTLEFYGHLVEDPQAFEAANVIGELLAGSNKEKA